MHQTIYGSLNLNENLAIDSQGDYQPLCTYSHAGTLFSIGAQFEGTKIMAEDDVTIEGFLITKMSLKMYCFLGSITIGFVDSGFSFQEDQHDEHVLSINIQSYNTNGTEDWSKNESSWNIFPKNGYFLKNNKILRTTINIIPNEIDATKSAQDYPFLDSYSYIRNGDSIEDKNSFLEGIDESFDLHKSEANQLNSIIERLSDENKDIKEELEEILLKKNILDKAWTIDPIINYFLKGRDRNCYQRDVRIYVN